MRILEVLGETDPAEFVDKVATMGADALLGNPSTLLLLHRTLAGTAAPVRTRGALLAEATRQMGQEINPMMPVRPDRPMASEVIAAAETACLVLLLSTREDIWMHGTHPPSPDYVMRDDLLPAHVDTQALRAALDSPMFTGTGRRSCRRTDSSPNIWPRGPSPPRQLPRIRAGRLCRWTGRSPF